METRPKEGLYIYAGKLCKGMGPYASGKIVRRGNEGSCLVSGKLSNSQG